MRPTFTMSLDGLLTSDLVPDDAPNLFQVGDRLCITRLLDIAPDIQIQAGERGTIDFIDAATGFVEILLDAFHKGLARWDNHLWLEPFGTDDILGGIICLCEVATLCRVA